MTMAIMRMRMQTLNRQIHKNQSRLSNLQSQLNSVQSAYTQEGRLYRQYFLQANGATALTAEDAENIYKSQLDTMGPVLLALENKEDNISLEIQEVNSELAQDKEEYKNVTKWIEDNAKKEIAHYTMS